MRKYGLPCVHCVGHAEYLGKDAEEIVHWKDSTKAWKIQYEEAYPVLSVLAIDTSVLCDPLLQYPPVAAPKCGRPKKVGRIKSSAEKRQRVTVRCSACGLAGHNARNIKCSKFGRS